MRALHTSACFAILALTNFKAYAQRAANKKAIIMDSATTTPTFTSGYSLVNGIKMYYEIYGKGDPLVLIHGGGSTIGTSFSKVIPLFAKTRQVIAVELQAHGHTEDRDAPESFEQDADDVAALLRNLHIDSADIMGFSNGGNTTMQLAIRNPQLVKKAVIASSFYKRDGFFPWFWTFMPGATLQNMPAELQEAFLKITPDHKKLEAMHNKDRDRMLHFKDWPDSALKAIKAPSLIIMGDKDVVTVEHAAAMSHLIPNCRLLVIPGGHGEYLGEITFKKQTNLPALTVGMIEDFLNDGRAH